MQTFVLLIIQLLCSSHNCYYPNTVNCFINQLRLECVGEEGHGLTAQLPDTLDQKYNMHTRAAGAAQQALIQSLNVVVTSDVCYAHFHSLIIVASVKAVKSVDVPLRAVLSSNSCNPGHRRRSETTHFPVSCPLPQLHWSSLKTDWAGHTHFYSHNRCELKVKEAASQPKHRMQLN